jgi:hypothetical protein
MSSLFQCDSDDDDSGGPDDIYADVWGDFVTTVTLYGMLGLGCFVFFEIMRSKQNVFASRANSMPHRMPALLPNKAVRWIKSLWDLQDPEVLNIVGMDGFVFLRFLGFCLRICFASMVMGLGVLMPVYYTSSGGSVESLFGKLTMDNLAPESKTLYCSAAGAVLLTLGVLLAVDLECKLFASSREQYMAAGDPDGEND